LLADGVTPSVIPAIGVIDEPPRAAAGCGRDAIVETVIAVGQAGAALRIAGEPRMAVIACRNAYPAGTRFCGGVAACVIADAACACGTRDARQPVGARRGGVGVAARRRRVARQRPALNSGAVAILVVEMIFAAMTACQSAIDPREPLDRIIGISRAGRRRHAIGDAGHVVGSKDGNIQPLWSYASQILLMDPNSI
jgi:hypothetical protein